MKCPDTSLLYIIILILYYFSIKKDYISLNRKKNLNLSNQTITRSLYQLTLNLFDKRKRKKHFTTKDFVKQMKDNL